MIVTKQAEDHFVIAASVAPLETAERLIVADKGAAEHTKECALMEECVKSGYGIYTNGKWYPFDAKGNELAKAMFEKTGKKDNIKATVEGMKHDRKILVQKITEE